MTNDQRKELLYQAARVLREDPPGVFLYLEPNVYGLGDRLTWKPTADQTISALDIRVR